MKITFSIITINYNNLTGLQKTIESVVSQTYKNIQYIVIDGNSSDGSKEFIHENSASIDYWVSEQDNGIYHAMNKGIQHAQGDYLLFLNSGDILFENETLNKINKYLDCQCDFIIGTLRTTENEEIKVGNQLSATFFLDNSIPHPSTFISKKMFTHEWYNESLKIVSDWEFFYKKLVLTPSTYKIVDQTISIFDTTGVSSRKSNEEIIRSERTSSLEKNISKLLFEDLALLQKMKGFEYQLIHRRIKTIQSSSLLWFLFRLTIRIFLLLIPNRKKNQNDII